jgi:ferredoxin
VERRLRHRGYAVACSGEAAYPDNWTLAINPPTGAELESALATGDAKSIQFANSILRREPARFRCAFIHKVWSWPVSILFRMFGRRMLGKAFIADGQCTSCGFCAASCPVQAIRMAGIPSRPRWNASCSGCYRCINLCPAKSIQISVPLLVFHLGLNVAVTVGWWFAIGWIFRQMAPRPDVWQWILVAAAAIAVYAFAMMLQLTAVDGLLHWIAARTPLHKLLLCNYTKTFGRYRAPGFQSAK